MQGLNAITDLSKTQPWEFQLCHVQVTRALGLVFPTDLGEIRYSNPITQQLFLQRKCPLSSHRCKTGHNGRTSTRCDYLKSLKVTKLSVGPVSLQALTELLTRKVLVRPLLGTCYLSTSLRCTPKIYRSAITNCKLVCSTKSVKYKPHHFLFLYTLRVLAHSPLTEPCLSFLPNKNTVSELTDLTSSPTLMLPSVLSRHQAALAFETNLP